MLGGWIMTEILEHSIVIGTVRTHHSTINTGLLAYDKVGASQQGGSHSTKESCEDNSIYSHINML